MIPRLFGFSTHSNMEECLLAAARSSWIDAVMFTCNFRLMNTPEMKAAVEACAQAGIGLTSFKTQAGGPVTADSEVEFRLMEPRSGYCAGCGRICLAAVGGRVPVSDVMRCRMYYRGYGDRELAREVFAGLPEETRSQLTETDYSTAEKACPQGLAIADLMAEASRLLA